VPGRPTISVVTTSLNQAQVMDATLRSVLDGSDAPDEYVVVDGGSTDGTADVVAEHAKRLTWWVSEPDDGQYAALDKGFARTTGDVMAWLNGGDLFMPWTVSVVRELFAEFPEMRWLTTQRPLTVDEGGRVVACEFVGAFAARSFFAGVNLPGSRFARAGIQQESTFWRRSLWADAGGRLATELRYAGDFELWLRFFVHAAPYALDSPLAAHRVHEGQKSGVLAPYVAEAEEALRRAGHSPGGGGSSAARRVVYGILGRRPLRRLPAAVAVPLRALGLLHATTTIVWRGGSWHTMRDYVV
jgi:hypothetical protein